MIEFRKMGFELRDIDSQTGEFEGIISTPTKDSYGTIIETKAFKKTAKESKGSVVVLFNHDPNMPVGLSTTIEPRENEVYARAKIDTSIDIGKRVLSGIKNGYLSDLSIGFNRVKDKWDKVRDAIIITELRLFEFSIVTKGFASNPDAGITSVRSVYSAINSLKSVNKDPASIRSAIKALEALLVEPAQTTQQTEEEPAPVATRNIEDEILQLSNLIKSTYKGV